jgi:outer membrane protein TolC
MYNPLSMSLFRFFTWLWCLAWASSTVAQAALVRTNFESIVAPLDSPATDFQEFLVQLAWINNPDGAIAMAELLNAADKASNIQKEWMRDVQLTFNLNEANITGTDNSSGNVFFPRYNASINLNLYNIASQKKKNTIGKREILMAEQRLKAQKMNVRAQTLVLYQSFLLARKIVENRSVVEQEMRNAYILIEQQYRTDEKAFDEFMEASTAYFKSQEERMKSETEALQAQLKLEEAIGLLWSQIQHPGKP